MIEEGESIDGEGPIAKPSYWPHLEIEFYHMGKTLLLSVPRARKLASDLQWAISEVEKANSSTKKP